MATAYPSDLTGWWCPSKDSVGNGTTTLNDLVGSNNGTLTNMDPATDWIDDGGGLWSLDFDGSNDEVVLPSEILSALPASISVWINPDLGSTDCVFAVNSNSNWSGFNLFVNSDGKIQALMGDNTGTGSADRKSFTTTSGITAGVWSHVVAVFNSISDVTIYINGSSVSTTTSGTASSIVFSGTASQFADSDSSSGFPFGGRLDDMRPIGRAYTSIEVSTLYDSSNGRGFEPAGGLVDVFGGPLSSQLMTGLVR